MKTKEEINHLAANLANPNVCKTTNWIEGYTQCKEDMADNSINFAEWLVNKYFMIHDKKWNNKNNDYDESDYTTKQLYDIFINSLNKQD